MDQFRNQSDFIKQTESLIISNLTNDQFSIDVLSKLMHISRSQLHRKIKIETGQSTSLFIRNIRLKKARDLLINSDTSISGIAYDVGFKTVQDFSKHFTKCYGISASAFRQSTTVRDKVLPNHNLSKVEVETKAVAESLLKSEIAQQATKVNENKQNRTKSLLATMGVLALLFSSLWYKHNLSTSKTELLAESNFKPNEQNSVAVLPFVLFGSDTLETFGFGLVEDILTSLAYFEGLKVISRTSSENYKNTNKSLKQIGRELDVKYILEGSVRQNKDELLITGQLIDSATDAHIWAKNYRVTADSDFFDVQNDISLDIAKLMGQNITAEAQLVLDYNQQENLVARREYLIGKELIAKRTESALKESLSYFDRALELDPEYSAAMLGKAEAFIILYEVYKTDKLDYANAKIYALEAIRLNPYSGRAHAILATCYEKERNLIAANESFLKALHYSPSSAITNYWYSLFFRSIGNAEASIKYSTIAKQLDPLYPVILSGHIMNCAYGGRRDLAEQGIEESKKLFPNSFSTLWAIAMVAECFEEYEKAIEYYEKVIELNPSLRSPAESIKYCQAKIGNPQLAIHNINTLDKSNHLDILYISFMFAAIEQMDSSLYYLDIAVDNKTIGGIINIYPRYKEVRDSDPFQEIVKKLKIPESLMQQ